MFLMSTWFCSPDALIMFESHNYPVREEDQIVTVCAVVERPEGLCDIGFSFNISLVTSDGSAGIHMPLIYGIYDHVMKPISSFQFLF